MNSHTISDFHFGWILWDHRMRLEAKPFLERALSSGSLSPNEKTWALLMMGHIHLAENEPYKALTKSREVLARKPKWIPAIDLALLAHRKLGTVKVIH